MINKQIKIMMWNVQGAAKPAFMSTLKEIIRINKPNVLGLVETHVSGDKAQQICNRIGFSGQVRVEAQGFSGGIWLFWRKEEVDVTPIETHGQHITVKIARVGEEPWMFSAIYANPDSSIRNDLWRALEDIKRSFNGPWLIAGDFNETRTIGERHGVGGSEMQRRCRAFSDWLDTNGLIDLHFSGPPHTWFRGDSEATFKSARLDRFVSNEDWRLKFEEGTVKHLPKACSDHCPILLSTCGFAPIPTSLKPFRFQAAWLTHEKFKEFMELNWNNMEPLIPFQKMLAIKLNEWNRDIFHNIFRKKLQLWARLEGVQKLLAKRRLHHLIEKEKELRKEMELVLYQEELLWFQKSRLDALRDGDRNTKYFHLSTIIRRRRNRIEMLMNSEGTWVSDPEEVKQMIVNYWEGLFREEDPSIQSFDFLHDCFPPIAHEDRLNLSKPFVSSEVKAAIMSMQPYKAPGPDGFQPVFYQQFWDLVAPSVTKTVMNVLEGREFPEDLNRAFLVLIPKEENP